MLDILNINTHVYSKYAIDWFTIVTASIGCTLFIISFLVDVYKSNDSKTLSAFIGEGIKRCLVGIIGGATAGSVLGIPQNIVLISALFYMILGFSIGGIPVYLAYITRNKSKNLKKGLVIILYILGVTLIFFLPALTQN